MLMFKNIAEKGCKRKENFNLFWSLFLNFKFYWLLFSKAMQIIVSNSFYTFMERYLVCVVDFNFMYDTYLFSIYTALLRFVWLLTKGKKVINVFICKFIAKHILITRGRVKAASFKISCRSSKTYPKKIKSSCSLYKYNSTRNVLKSFLSDYLVLTLFKVCFCKST